MDHRALEELELSLWRPATRFDRAHMEAVLHPDCMEFGRSGARYDRAELVGSPAEDLEAYLHHIEVDLLEPDVALVTYISEVMDGGHVLVSNRSSVWLRDETHGWRLRFHQGTPTTW